MTLQHLNDASSDTFKLNDNNQNKHGIRRVVRVILRVVMNKLRTIMLCISMTICMATQSGEWSLTSNITQVYLHKDYQGYALISMSDEVKVNPGECKNNSHYAIMKNDNAIFSEMYSMMLAAYMSGKKVKVYI